MTGAHVWIDREGEVSLPTALHLVGTAGLERIAAELPEPHSSRLRLLAHLRRVLAMRRLAERRALSAFAHERTRQVGRARPRYVIHRGGCVLVTLRRVAARPGVPDCGASRVRELDEVWLCGNCRPALADVLGEYA